MTRKDIRDLERRQAAIWRRRANLLSLRRIPNPEAERFWTGTTTAERVDHLRYAASVLDPS